MMAEDFSNVFSEIVKKYGLIPSYLSKESNVSQRQIKRWLYESVRRPRYWLDIVAVASVARLRLDEVNRLLGAAGYPSVAELFNTAIKNQEISILSFWEEELNQLQSNIPFSVPRQLPYFVGRTKEIQQLKELLVSSRHSFIFSIEGMGGVGKTSLAIHLAYSLRHYFTDGIIWIPVDKNDPMSMLRIIAAAYKLDVSSNGSLSQLASIIRGLLSNKRTLIILDNVRNSKEIEDLNLPTGSNATIITTRHRNISFARKSYAKKFLIKPFDEAETVNLFVEILGEEFTVEHINELKEIAYALGYLPLALDIVGSRIAIAYEPNLDLAIFLEQIKHEIKRLDELKYEDLSVRATFNISFDALPSKEQGFYSTLGVFGGDDFDVEAAAFVAKISYEESKSMLRVLCDLSLVQYAYTDRYRLHSLMRDFTREKLRKSLRGKKAYEEMANYFLGLLEKVKEVAEADDERAALKLLDEELSNIKYGYMWTVDNMGKDRNVAILCNRFALASPNFLKLRFNHSEQLKWYQAGLASARYLNDYKSKAIHLTQLGEARARIGANQLAINHFNYSLAIIRENRLYELEANTINQLGLVYRNIGKIETAIKLFEEAVKLSRETSNRQIEWRALGNLGVAYALQSNFDDAIQFMEEQLKITQEIGALRGMGNALNNLGLVYSRTGASDRAIDYYERTLDIRREMGDRMGESETLNNLGLYQLNKGNLDEASALNKQALNIARAMIYPRNEAYALGNLGIICTLQNDIAKALEYFNLQLQVNRSYGFRRGEAKALKSIAYAYVKNKNPSPALEPLEQALSIFRALDARSEVADTLNLFCRVYTQLGEFDLALEFIKEAQIIIQDVGYPKIEAMILWAECLAYAGIGKLADAIASCQEALSILKKLGANEQFEVQVVLDELLNKLNKGEKK